MVHPDLQSSALPLLSSRICNSAAFCHLLHSLAACGHKHPSQARKACSWMIWPSGGGWCLVCPPAVGGALSAAVYDWILRCCWFYVSTDSVCFSRFATCCPASVLAGLQSAMLCVTAFLQSADCRRGRSSAPGSKNHRTALYCRQAAILCNRSTEIRFGGSAPLHRCPSLHSGHRPLTAADG